MAARSAARGWWARQRIGADGSYDPSSTYTILTADGGVDGEFDGVTSNFAFLDPTLDYPGNDVTLTLTRNDTGFDDVGETRNQIAAAAGIESLGMGDEIHDAVVALDAVTARFAFDQLSGEIHASALDRADREDGDVAETKTVHLQEKIEGLRRQMQSLKAMGKQVEAVPDKQVSLTDPDARSMATSGKGTGIVGYNVQIAVDAEHHLIVTHEVTNIGSDRAQLTSVAHKAREATGCEAVTVLADRGYYSRDEVLACEGTGILPLVPKTRTSGNTKRGRFTVEDFIYDTANDRYTCPAGKHLTRGKVRSDRRDNIDQYRNLTACSTCVLKPRCTPDKLKRLKRWEHEGVLDKMQERLDCMPEAMSIRRQTAEHPFATFKAWMGSTPFLTRTLEKVKTEMSLQVLAYNMKRMINIFGVKPLMQAIAA